MLIKTGDAEILNVVNPEEVEKDNERPGILASALEKAKKIISKGDLKSTQDKTEN